MGAGRVGVMGGGFDPPHMFHVAIAERAREFLGLDIVVFLPADSSPPKFGSHAAPFADRVEMLKIALRNFPGPFEICDAEARAEGVFYAADAARVLAEKFSGARLYWIMGSDRAAGLHRWKDIEKLSELASFAFFKRAGDSVSGLELLPKGAEVAEVPFVSSSASSASARAALGEGKTPADIDPEVAAYISKKGLYSRALRGNPRAAWKIP